MSEMDRRSLFLASAVTAVTALTAGGVNQGGGTGRRRRHRSR